jgi:hypothetical protein
MSSILTVQFTRQELNWLQVNLQGFNEEKSTQMGESDENHPIGGGKEHGWFQDFLDKVRSCIINPSNTVQFTDLDQLNFIRKWFTDYKNTTGEYIFQGPYGTSQLEGGQFPDTIGSANSNFQGQGSFPDQSFQAGANIFNSILAKLGDIVIPPLDPVDHSNGSI